MNLILHFHERAHEHRQARRHNCAHPQVAGGRYVDPHETSVDNEELDKLDEIRKAIDEQMDQLEAEYK